MPDISKLPVWAQTYITKLEREREAAIETLMIFRDTATPSPISFEEHPCLGENGRGGPTFLQHYIQATDVKFVWGGVELNVMLRGRGQTGSGDHILIQYGQPKHTLGDVMMQPRHHQCVSLFLPGNGI